MSKTSSQRLMYVQFTSCVYGASSLKSVSEQRNIQNPVKHQSNRWCIFVKIVIDWKPLGVIAKVSIVYTWVSFKVCLCCVTVSLHNWPYYSEPCNMVRHTETICRVLPTNCLSVVDHFLGLALEGWTYLRSLRPAILLSYSIWHRCFPANFAKFQRTPFNIEHLWWLLLLFFNMSQKK